MATNMFKLTRTMGPEKGKVFFAMPFGTKKVGAGDFNFDEFYADECVPIVRDDCGMEPVRGDEIYGSQGVWETVWNGIQQAELVVVDFTARSTSVVLEFGWAVVLGKRVVVLTQDPEDVPTDVRGIYRFTEYGESYKAMKRLREELALQLKTMREQPAEEMALMPMPMPDGGSMTSVPARVIVAMPDYVVVQDDSGRRGVMGNDDVDYARLIKDMSRRFPVGTRLDGAFVVDPLRKEMRYTLTGGEINPWPLLARRFPPGTPLHQRVTNVVAGVGAFVHVDRGINGLVPAAQFNGELPQPGTELAISVVRIDEHRRQVALRLNGAVRQASTARFAELGWSGDGEVTRAVPEQADHKGGFILVRLPVADRPAMLLAKDMTDDLRHDLNNGHVEVGEVITVEVTMVDARAGKTLLREVPEEDAAEELPAAA
ncbi:hypothetical protein [Nocardia nepalensis]|uniref:hypothetical protein n=1 Tax=Nocardia nepalensis TaxID=3375448 RepID=UPI003B67A5B9